MIGLLSIAIFLPAVLAAPTFLLGRKNPKMAKILGVGTTAIVFAISILILVVFQYGQAGFQLSESLPWAGSFGLNYKVGIDGISLPLLMIATFLASCPPRDPGIRSPSDTRSTMLSFSSSKQE